MVDYLNEILECLPEKIKTAVMFLARHEISDKLSEIRLRAGSLQTLVVGGKELVISSSGKAETVPGQPLILSSSDLSEIVFKLCDGSVYSHFDELRNGFISKKGIRIGVCGNGVMKNGMPSGFSAYSSLNIRIPRHIPHCADRLLDVIRRKGTEYVGGILVISPPCCGKTTFLRTLSGSLSHSFFDRGILCRKRICVIDERGELYSKEAFDCCLADFITFLPKDYSIELATRVLSPEYIVCDEIGNDADAMAICEGATKGVTFIASCHGRSISDVLEKKHLSRLFRNKVFSTACELSCHNGEYRCDIRRYAGDGERL